LVNDVLWNWLFHWNSHLSVNRVESEVNLIQQAARGDVGAFEVLFTSHFQAVYNYALSLSGDPALAEDLTQDAFIRAHGSLARFGAPWKIRPWLFQITRNLLQDAIRRGRELSGSDEAAILQDPGPTPEQTMVSTERRARIRMAISQLPELHREALILRELEGLSYEDIAATMGVSLQYVRVLIHRARAKFQENYVLRLLAEEPLPDCTVLAERLDALHDGEPLGAEEERFVREHLRDCHLCQQRRRELAALSGMLGAGLPVQAPAGLDGRVWNRVRLAERWRRLGPRAAAAGGLAAILLVLSLFGWRALAAPAGGTPALPIASPTFTPPSTSNALFYTPTAQASLPSVPSGLPTQTLTAAPVLGPDIQSIAPTSTFTPLPPTPVPDTSGPAIDSFNHKPATIYSSGSGSCSPLTALITATITDPSGVQSAVVIFAHTSLGSVAMSNIGGSTWRASLGPFSGVGDGSVDYQVRAFDSLGNRSDTGFQSINILACLK
jgi:RNA polymerase sigma-70 factor (ECF subfamily)